MLFTVMENIIADYDRPRIHFCPINIISYRDFRNATWLEPIVTDNSREEIPLSRTGPKSGAMLAVGTHRVTYNARDSASNKAFPCSFTVNVRRMYITESLFESMGLCLVHVFDLK